MMSTSLPDCVAITGTSRGLGWALADALLRQSVHVICIGRSFTQEQEDYAAHGQGTMLSVDLHDVDYEAVRHRLHEIIGRGRSAALICNAATVQPIQRTGSGHGSSIAASIEGNVAGTVRLTEAFLEALQKSDIATSIVNVSSGASLRPIQSWAAYCTSKAALDMYFSCVALEHPDVSVERVDPGVIDTSMQAEIRAAANDAFPLGTHLQDLARDGLLQTPEAAARRLLDQVFTDKPVDRS